MADENIQIINVQNSDGTKQHYSSLDGMRYINTNVGALSGGVDIALGASGLVLQTNTNDPPNKQNTLIYNNTFTNSVGDINAPSTLYTTDLITIAQLDSTIPAVEIAPNGTTLKVQDTLMLTNAVVDTQILCNGSNQLELFSNGNEITINSGASNVYIGDTVGSQHFTRMVLNDNAYNIDLDCINLTTNNGGCVLPICFSSKQQGSINYGNVSNFENVLTFNVPFPSFALSSNTNVSFTDWKIEFALNCRNMTDQVNKELAIYFELEDTNTATYTPFLFKQTTPYTTHKNASTYTFTSSASENYVWTDYVNLNGVNGAVPLQLRLYWFANAANSFDYELLVSFTRTNII